ncbi:TIGR04104 family putative zinc finger protein [Clostridium sp. LIBA-8841]|uniref:TIGR04104 family putative zinc finger protein n=1 Tax=Clostridium sp. LIBA-8841 TaxID=2987530 RepID=UPI002AC41C10|nr:TIGR04104 family putative zinc finger protein [Clostridium sp. LIBA-8841]MDZ5253601.1 hypothetical protein [Clostridium sp. LIBA-8841]
MRKCVKCKEKFSYIDLLVALWGFSGYGYIKCSNCNTEYKVIPLSRVIISLLIVFPFLIEGYIKSFNFSYCILYLIIIIPMTPFMVRFKESNDSKKYMKL